MWLVLSLNLVGFGYKNEKYVLCVSYEWNRSGQLSGYSK